MKKKKKKKRGCTLELLKKICKRDPVLWAWLELFSPLQFYIVTETFNLFTSLLDLLLAVQHTPEIFQTGLPGTSEHLAILFIDLFFFFFVRESTMHSTVLHCIILT